MSGVFQNIDPPAPAHLTAQRVCTPPPLLRGEDTLSGWRGGGGSIFQYGLLEDFRHCSVLYICKYFLSNSVLFVVFYFSLVSVSCQSGETYLRFFHFESPIFPTEIIAYFLAYRDIFALIPTYSSAGLFLSPPRVPSVKGSVLDRQRIDADPDPDPTLKVKTMQR